MEKRWKEVPQDDAGIRSKEEGKEEELTQRHKDLSGKVKVNPNYDTCGSKAN